MEKTNEASIRKPSTKRLSLVPVEEKEGLYIGTRSNGKTYTVRKDRHRVFFPDEWLKFTDSLKESQVFIFDTLLNSGARIEECLNIRVKDFFLDRNYLRLYVTKSKAKKGESKEFGGQPRSFTVSSQYIKRVKQYVKDHNLKEEDKLFNLTQQAVYQLMRKRLQLIGIKDWYNFSLHNIRKTHGMWLKTLMPYSRQITEGEICNRLGHDFNTYLRHYSSPSIFNEKDKEMMIKILGDVYGLDRSN